MYHYSGITTHEYHLYVSGQHDMITKSGEFLISKNRCLTHNHSFSTDSDAAHDLASYPYETLHIKLRVMHTDWLWRRL